jgi:hypothetical protein
MKNDKEIARMKMLAGLITEGQYKKLIKEEDYNAIDSMAPDWQDEDGYELVLDQYFDTYGLEDPEEFAFEVFDNGDAQNNLAFDIAKRAGFKGEDIMDLIDEEDFNRYCNMLAQFFLLKHGNAMGSISEEEYPEYEKRIKQLNTELPKLKAKAQPTIDQLQGK